MTDSPPRAKWHFFDRVLVVLIGVFVIYFILPNLIGAWPPNWLERRNQRKELIARVESVGGVGGLAKGLRDACRELLREFVQLVAVGIHKCIPPAIAALKPMEVQFESPAFLRNYKSEATIAVVRIRVFGVHSTGGHSTPFYGLEVVCGSGTESYQPGKSPGGFSGSYLFSRKKLTNQIYEVYEARHFAFLIFNFALP